MTRKLLLVAGGTGGHIWPAISFGKWIEKNKPDITVSYLCGNRPMELEIYRAAGIEPHQLNIKGSPFSANGLEKFKRTYDHLSAVKESARIIKSLAPNFTLLFGGYISFPVLLACRMSKRPVVIHEQNAFAGKVTRIASMMGVEVFSGWSQCFPLASSKFTRIGVPVREFVKVSPREAWQRLGIPEKFPDGPKLLVFSGSLGSSAIKDIVIQICSDKEFSTWTFILPAISEKIERVHENVFLLPKVWEAELLYSLADIAVVRGGGSTLTEVAVHGIPSIVIPWSGAADNHQYHNAVAFSSENKAILWDGNGSSSDFAKCLIRLYDTVLDKNENDRGKQQNSAGRICENLWLTLSSYF